MVNILRCFVRCGTAPDEIVLCAPTGRAAQRMTEAIYSNIRTIQNPEDCDIAIKEGVKAATLHKALRFRPRFNDFFYNERNPLPAAVAVVDEATMVDVAMMEKFLRAIDSERTTLIILGDKDQLPSVDAGAVFAEMIPREGKSETFHDRLVILKKTYRSEKRLQELAARINRCEWPDPTPVSLETALTMEKDSWAMVETETAAKWKNDLILWAEDRLLGHGHAENEKGKTSQESKGKKGGVSVQYNEENIRRADLKELSALASATAPSELSGRQGEKQYVLYAPFERTMACRILTLVKQGIYGAVEINRFLASHLTRRLSDRHLSGLEIRCLPVVFEDILFVAPVDMRCRVVPRAVSQLLLFNSHLYFAAGPLDAFDKHGRNDEFSTGKPFSGVRHHVSYPPVTVVEKKILASSDLAVISVQDVVSKLKAESQHVFLPFVSNYIEP